MLALVASCVVREDNALAPLLSLWPMRRVGLVSYGINPISPLVLHFVHKGLSASGVAQTQGFATFAVTAFATWASGGLSYRLFEIRFLALKTRYGSQSPIKNIVGRR